MTIRESDIEQYLVDRTYQVLGGRCNKLVSPGRRGVADRLLLWPDNGHAFIEVKQPGEKPSKKQWLELVKLWGLNQNATWVDTKEKVDQVVEDLANSIKLDEDYTRRLHGQEPTNAG